MDLRELRESCLLTLADVFYEMGIQRSNLSKIENGVHYPTPSTLRKLAEMYEVDFAVIRQAANNTRQGKEIHA